MNSVHVAAVSGEDDVQGKFMYSTLFHKRLVFMYLNKILLKVMVAALTQDNTLNRP
jgi:hypothetical protein